MVFDKDLPSRSFLPNRISGQMALIVVASLAVIHVVGNDFLISRLARSTGLDPGRSTSFVTLGRG